MFVSGLFVLVFVSAQQDACACVSTSLEESFDRSKSLEESNVFPCPTCHNPWTSFRISAMSAFILFVVPIILCKESLEFSTFLVVDTPKCADAVMMELCNDGSAFGIMLGGNAIIDLGHLLSFVCRDEIDRDACLQEQVA